MKEPCGLHNRISAIKYPANGIIRRGGCFGLKSVVFEGQNGLKSVIFGCIFGLKSVFL